MLFHSLDFAIFLPIVFFLYWFFLNNSVKFQNILIVISSYVFYGWWDWRFLSLIIFSTFIDYSVGKKLAIENQQTKRKVLLWVSIFFNIGILAIFKYYNFFLENFIDAFAFFGLKINAGTLNIILPVGISFYTFQTMSYSIDIYKKKVDSVDLVLEQIKFSMERMDDRLTQKDNILEEDIIKVSDLFDAFKRKTNRDLRQIKNDLKGIGTQIAELALFDERVKEKSLYTEEELQEIKEKNNN